MAVKKLTLSAPEEVIAETKLIAAKKRPVFRHFFAAFIRTIDQELIPKTLRSNYARASGIVKLPTKQTERELLKTHLLRNTGGGDDRAGRYKCSDRCAVHTANPTIRLQHRSGHSPNVEKLPRLFQRLASTIFTIYRSESGK